MKQSIKEINEEWKTFIEKQNDWVKGHFSPESQYKYESTEGKIYLLKGILNQKMYTTDQTAELQALGICFGEILVEKFKLKWVVVNDEYGEDPALQFSESSSILLFPRTMISKRIEDGEIIDIDQLLSKIKETLSNILKND